MLQIRTIQSVLYNGQRLTCTIIIKIFNLLSSFHIGPSEVRADIADNEFSCFYKAPLYPYPFMLKITKADPEEF